MQNHLNTSHHPRAKVEGLDGLRALAVMAVIIYHADIEHFLPGGFLGVDVFFVLSGFLITRLLFKELEASGTISLAHFYIRRTRRLLPALLCVLSASALYTVWFARDAISALQSDLLPALLYFSNFWQLVDAQPYFERFGRPHALQHLWSLAIEEQFYLLWPPLLMLLYRCRRAVPLPLVVGGLAACSAAWMALLAYVYNVPFEHPPERLYFGTDTHAMGLLLGAMLASFADSKGQAGRGGGWLSQLLGSTALAYLLSCFFFLDESSGFLYRGGFASVSLATLLLIQSASHHGSLTNVIFRNSMLDWLGKRSYSLYLWHWPIFVYFRPGEELPDNLLVATLIRLGVTLLLAQLTYHLIEQPIRIHGLRAFGRFARPVFGMASIALMAAFFTLLLSQAPREAESESAMGQSNNGVIAMPDIVHEASEPVSALAALADVQSSTQMGTTDTMVTTQTEADGMQEGPAAALRITALGDSVMLGAQQVMTQRLPISYLNAKVGRQGSDLLKLVKQIGSSKVVSDTVLIHIGTNGYIYEQNLQQLLQLLRDKKKLVFVNVHANRRWTEENNALLRKYRVLSDNMVVVDWNAISARHPEYFVKDGIHLTGKGMAAYVEVIRSALGVAVEQSPVKTNVARVIPAQGGALQGSARKAADVQAASIQQAAAVTTDVTAVPGTGTGAESVLPLGLPQESVPGTIQQGSN